MSSRTRSEFGTLSDRASGGAPASDEVRVVDPRHVWVDADHPGLLLAWRHLAAADGAAWQGRVFWCPPDLGEAALDWLDQTRLQPG